MSGILIAAAVNRQPIYDLRHADPFFAKAWEEAVRSPPIAWKARRGGGVWMAFLTAGFGGPAGL